MTNSAMRLMIVLTLGMVLTGLTGVTATAARAGEARTESNVSREVGALDVLGAIEHVRLTREGLVLTYQAPASGGTSRAVVIDYTDLLAPSLLTDRGDVNPRAILSYVLMALAGCGLLVRLAGNARRVALPASDKKRRGGASEGKRARTTSS